MNQLFSYLGRSHFKSDRYEDSLREQCEERSLMENAEILRRHTIRDRSVSVDVINRMIHRMDMAECVEAYRTMAGGTQL